MPTSMLTRRYRWQRIWLLLALLFMLAMFLPPPLGPSEPEPALAQTSEVAFVTGSGPKVQQVDLTTGVRTIVTLGDKLSEPLGIARASNGDLLIADRSCCDQRNRKGGVIRVNPSTGAQTIVSAGNSLLSQFSAFEDPTGIAIAANGDLYVTDSACCSGGKGGVIRVDPTTGVQTIVSSGGSFSGPGTPNPFTAPRGPAGIAIAANGDLLVVDRGCCENQHGAVIRVNPTTGAQTIVSSGSFFSIPTGVAIASNGDLLISDTACCANGAVFRVNPATGAQTHVSSGGDFFVFGQTGIAMAANGDFVVASGNCCLGGRGAVIRVNPTTGAQVTLGRDETFRPYGIAIGPGVAPPPMLTTSNATVQEGDSGTSSLTFTVNLTPPSTQSVSVQYATQYSTGGSSAQAGLDYVATSGTLTFSPGEISKTIVVTVIGDTQPEIDETIDLMLSSPANALLAQVFATGTIVNDDGPMCSQQPKVTRTQSVSGGALNVTVRATVSNSGVTYRLFALRFGTIQNALVTVNGQPVSSGEGVTLSGGSISANIVVRRAVPGQATTVPFTIVDSCGEWRTFVGGGVSAGF